MAISNSVVTLHGTDGEYSISSTQDGNLQIIDLVGNRDGAHIYTGTQQIAFANAHGLFDPTGTAESVARLYEAVVSRTPDLSGLVGYTDQLSGTVFSGLSNLVTVANSMIASDEFVARFGQPTNAEFVQIMYQNALGRAADAGGLASYTALLDAGQSRGAVAVDIGESFEARQHSLNVAGYQSDATVYRLYSALLNRVPDAGGEQTYSAALDHGQTIQDLATAMLSSAEYQAEAANVGNADFVSGLYRNLLNRDADPGGLQSYTNDLSNGVSRAQMVSVFVDSTEARGVTAQATHDSWVSTT